MLRPFRLTVCALAVAVGLASATWAAGPSKPAASSPEVRLTITPHGVGELWQMEVTNTGSAPLRIVADARLLRLEVIPPSSPSSAKASKSFVCELPASMRSDARTLVLPAGARYVEAFDPRMFCLDASSSLVDGAIVVARLGWTPPSYGKLGAPFVVVPATAPSGSSAEGIAAAKEIAASAVVLDAKASAVAAAPPASTSAPSSSSSTVSASIKIATSTSASASASTKLVAALPTATTVATAPLLVVKGGAAKSISLGKWAEATIVVHNPGPDTRSVYARPQLVAAMVRGPRGDRTMCDGPTLTPAPIVDFVSKLSVGASWSTTITLSDLCPAGTFDRAGLYEITPLLHAIAIPSMPKAVVGDLVAISPELLRIEVGDKPYHDLLPIAVLAKP